MTTTTSDGPAMIDRADTETTLYRAAICAFTYYPGKPADDPGYSIDQDVAWCTAPLRRLPAEELAELCAVVRRLIVDPAADRRAFIAALAELAGE